MMFAMAPRSVAAEAQTIAPPSAEAIKLKLSTPDLIMEGIRRIRAWTRIERAVGGPEMLEWWEVRI